MLEKKVLITVRRGDVVYVNTVGVGHEQNGTRPAIVIQNNIGNKFSPTVIVAFLTTQTDKKDLPTHVLVSKENCTFSTKSFKTSKIMLEQIKTVDKTTIEERIATVTLDIMKKVDECILISLGMK